jgi:hypothetical protein
VSALRGHRVLRALDGCRIGYEKGTLTKVIGHHRWEHNEEPAESDGPQAKMSCEYVSSKWPTTTNTNTRNLTEISK